MKKLLKAILSFAIALTAAFGVLPTAVTSASAAQTGEVLDVYLIAGQSNAVGLSRLNSLTCSDEKKQEYATGYSNVLYRGHGDSINVTEYDKTVTSGLGSDKNCIGTELGIAETLSARDEQKTSLIIKRAVGGSYLVDEYKVSTEQARITQGNAGNWCPPSKRGQTPLSDYTGALYDDFVSIVKESVEYYQTQGYTVLLKGTFWMQGEAESDPVNIGGSTTKTVTQQEYAEHLTALIADLREDFKNTFDNDAASAPFVVGKIAPTFNGGGVGVEKIRAAQDSVAQSVLHVHTVETEDYVIVDPTTNTPVTGCADRYHFCGDDIVSLGHDVANAFIRYGEAGVEVRTDGNGVSNIKYQKLDDSPLTVTFTPNEHYSIGKLTANGVDVTAQMQGNSYTVENTGVYVVLDMQFDEDDKYTMSLSYNRDYASIQKSKGAYFYYVGETLSLKVIPKTGYEVASVTFDGQAVQANDKGEYEITITSGQNVFAVTFNQVEVIEPEIPQTDNSSIAGVSGCSSSFGGFGGLAALGVAVLALIKSKKNER